MKYWEIIADHLSNTAWTWGYSSHIDSSGRLLFAADAYRDNGKRFIVRADGKLTMFLELESEILGTIYSPFLAILATAQLSGSDYKYRGRRVF
jgi:hypothetical protein